MKKVKQITFDITQSRRIKNYAQKLKIKEEVLLKKYQHTMHIVFQAWNKNYGENSDVTFRDFFLIVMKYAEFAFRLKERHRELDTINHHLVILRDAIEEYNDDYKKIKQIEEIVKKMEGF